jgi:hypothetical protein
MSETRTIRAIYEGGVFRPLDDVSLEEHAEVEVVIPSSPAVRDPDDPTGWKAIRRLIGAGKATSPDVSERHDDYLYASPDEHDERRRPGSRRPRDPGDPTGWKAINHLIGAGPGPPDLARNHDKYIYDEDDDE